jgi:ATP-dependent Lon protease
LAAHRAGIRRVILPARNEGDLEDIPKEVRDELEIILVTRIGEAVEAALDRVVANPPPAATTDAVASQHQTDNQPAREPEAVRVRSR